MLLNRLKRISPTIRSLPTWGCYVLSDARYYVTAHSTTVSIQIVCDLDRMTIVACIPEKNQFFSLEYSNQFLPSVEPCMWISVKRGEGGMEWCTMEYPMDWEHSMTTRESGSILDSSWVTSKCVTGRNTTVTSRSRCTKDPSAVKFIAEREHCGIVKVP